MSQSTTCSPPLSADALSPEPGRRTGTPELPVGAVLCIQTWTGLCVGSTVALLTFLTARYGVPAYRSMLAPLTALAPMVALCVTILIGRQMRAVRNRSFLRKVRGVKQAVRIRRRGEVLWEVAKRGLLVIFLGVLLVCAVHGAHGFLRQVGAVKTLSLMAAFPFLGRWLDIALATALASGLVLLAGEMVSLLTRKQGYPYQDTAIFVPAATAFGLVLWLLTSL